MLSDSAALEKVLVVPNRILVRAILEIRDAGRDCSHLSMVMDRFDCIMSSLCQQYIGDGR